jgi:hypothetical protein
VPNPQNDNFLWHGTKNNAEVVDPEPSASLPLSGKPLYIAFARIGVPGQRAEDSNGHLAVDGAQLGSRGLRPDELHRRLNSRRTCETTKPVRTSVVALSIASESPAVTGSSSSGVDTAR